MAQEFIDVLMAVDDAYLAPATVTISSIVRVTRDSGVRVRLHLIDNGLSAERRTRFEKSLGEVVDVAFYTAEDRLTLTLAPAYNDYLSSASMSRLQVGELLPDSVQRVLYLDADLLVLEDPSILWSTDLQGRCVGAVRDGGWPTRRTFIGEDGGPEERSEGAPEPGYFNSGVMMIDLPRWRAEEIYQQSAQLHAAVGNQLRAPDQDILNMVLQAAWTPLPSRWNLLIMRQKTPGVHQEAAEKLQDFLLSQQPGPQRDEWQAYLDKRQGIIHYSGRAKPWQERFPEGPLKELYAEHMRLAQDLIG